MLALGGALFYLAGLTPLRQYLQRLAGLEPPRPAVPNPANPIPAPVGAHPPQVGGRPVAAEPPGVAPPNPGGNPGANWVGQAGAPVPGGNPPEPAAGIPPAPGNGVRPAGGLLHELQAFVVGFFTSLLPGELVHAPFSFLASILFLHIVQTLGTCESSLAQGLYLILKISLTTGILLGAACQVIVGLSGLHFQEKSAT